MYPKLDPFQRSNVAEDCPLQPPNPCYEGIEDIVTQLFRQGKQGPRPTAPLSRPSKGRACGCEIFVNHRRVVPGHFHA